MTIKDQLVQHKAEILRLRDALNSAFSGGMRPSPTVPEDRVIFPLGVACRDLFEEILFAVSDGFGRSALRSVRTFYECLVFSRYLSLHPEKVSDYLSTFHAQWAKVARDIPNVEKTLPEIHAELAAKVPRYKDGKSVSLEWSEDTTRQMAAKVGVPDVFHAMAFNYTSGFVHPSGLFLMSLHSQVDN